MASLLAASAARRRFPILMSFYARLSSTTCYFERREGEGEGEGEKERRSEGENLDKRILDAYRTLRIRGYNESEIKSVSQPLTVTAEAPDISPKPQTADIFVPSTDRDGYRYFRAYSVDEEDGSMSPKYYIYPPSLQKWRFRGATCNGVLHLMNSDWEQILWNPITEECKTLPMPFVPRHGLDGRGRDELMVSGMWYDHTRENYKLLQLIKSNVLAMARETNYVWHSIWLYSLESDSWKEMPPTHLITVCNDTSACINDVFYCAASLAGHKECRSILSTETLTKIVKKSGGIMSFNFSTETRSMIDLPFIDGENVRYRILEYKGLLSIVVYFDGVHLSRPSKYALWVMNDGLWIRESVFHVSYSVGKPLWFSKNGRFLYFESEHGGVVFDRATEKLKKLGIHISTESNGVSVVESFVQLNGVSVVEDESTSRGRRRRRRRCTKVIRSDGAGAGERRRRRRLHRWIYDW